jgi:hypothetical protein
VPDAKRFERINYLTSYSKGTSVNKMQMKSKSVLRMRTVKPSAGFIGRRPEEFDQLPENAIIKNIKTKEFFQKKKKRWIKL